MSEDKQVNAPPSFTDASGRTWTINLTLGLADHIQESTGLDLLTDDGDTAPLLGLLFDSRKLGNVLWSAIESQAAERHVSRDDFLNATNGETLTLGWGALVDAIVFFTPPQRREAVRAAIEAQLEMLGQGAAAVAEVAASQETNQAVRDRVNQIKNELQAALPKALANSATNSEGYAA